jgi:hypothetical protein
LRLTFDVFTGQIVFIWPGLQARLDAGVIDPVTFDGFHGLIGFDINGDGVADVTTFIVTPNFELPVQAQVNGALCHGIVSIVALITQC